LTKDSTRQGSLFIYYFRKPYNRGSGRWPINCGNRRLL